MKTYKIIFWVVTGLLSALMLMSVGMYFFNYDEVSKAFTGLGFPTYIIRPLGTLKLLGVATILTRKYPVVTEWAYAGFFFNFVLAASAHLNAGDGEAGGSFMALVLLIASYITSKKAFA